MVVVMGRGGATEVVEVMVVDTQKEVGMVIEAVIAIEVIEEAIVETEEEMVVVQTVVTDPTKLLKWFVYRTCVENH